MGDDVTETQGGITYEPPVVEKKDPFDVGTAVRGRFTPPGPANVNVSGPYTGVGHGTPTEGQTVVRESASVGIAQPDRQTKTTARATQGFGR